MTDGKANGSGIGQPVRRKEDLRLVRGNGRYSDDLNLPNQAVAVMVRSNHAHARIKSIQTDEAARAAGVIAVFTYLDIAQENLQPIPHTTWSKHPLEIQLKNRGGGPAFIPPHYLMPHSEVHHVGEIIAMVVAETLDAAKEGADAVLVEYEELPAVARAIDAADRASARTRTSGPSNVSIDADVGNKEETEAAFSRAAHVVSLKTWIPRVSGVPMEPRAAIGDYNPRDGIYTLYAGIGGVIRPRGDLANILGVPENKVRVVMHDVGGNFGTRGGFNPEFGLVAWAARKVGRPVKWTSARHEFFLADFQARDLHSETEMALDQDGNVLALRGSNISNLGAYAVGYGPLTKGLEITSSIYHVPAVFFRGQGVLTNTVPTRPYRSAGRPEVMFVIERLLDIAARECGFDRIDLRRRNLVPESAMPYTNPFGLVYDSGTYHKVMERALELGDWKNFEARRAEALRRGKYRGIGVGNYVDTGSGFPRERAEITVCPDGVVECVIGTTSQGQGHETSFAQLINEFLGVPFEDVRLITGDTARVSAGGGAHSGRALRMGSVVIFNASRDIIARGAQIAGHLLGAEPSDVEFRAGRYHKKDVDRSVGLVEVAKAATDDSALPHNLRGPVKAISDEQFLVLAFPYGCQVCEVEIDPETGATTIVQHVAVDDCGRAVNPMIVHGQTHGGIAQGVGEALIEECVYERDSVQPLCGSFMDYAMPRADMFPNFVTELSEVPCTTHPLGIRPGGEGGTTPALAVVINAVVDALSPFGVRHVEMPATPQRIWQAIRTASGEK
jgi:carbon-monoxide dehydrogenase large subunit